MWCSIWSFILCLFLFEGCNVSNANLDAGSETVGFDSSERQPLILTPYVEKGKIEEGQNAARVSGILKDVESYSGYFTVNETEGRNLFFWYFPSEENPETSPVMIWLQGGPGCSSMYGLLMEHGPFQLSPDGSPVMRPHRWTRSHHVIYIDSPAGTGFSFPGPGGLDFGEQQISSDLHSFLQQFFQLFPKLVHNDFYVAGESYAGYMVPSTAYAIHLNNPTAKVKINLRGLLIGNGIVNLSWGASSDYCTQIGMSAMDCEKYYNYIHQPPEPSVIDGFLNQDLVQESVHVGQVDFEAQNLDIFFDVARGGDDDYMLAPVLAELLQHYDLLYYYGQLDCVCPYPYVEQFISTFDWSGAAEYRKAKRVHWKVDGELAGYVKTGGNLTLALVRNAGHMVPSDQPIWALDLITRFIKKSHRQL